MSDSVVGDCSVLTCVGTELQAAVDLTDTPPSTACSVGLCADAGPSVQPKPAGTPCGDELVCDGAGHCLGCASPNDCPAAGECRIRECSTDGECVEVLAPPRSACAGGSCTADGKCGCGSSEDCGESTSCHEYTCELGLCGEHFPLGNTCNGGLGVCDGTGECVQCLDDSNCFPDLECTDKYCDVDNTCKAASIATGSPCLITPDGVCNVFDVCVECINDSNCPDVITPCGHYTCGSGTCNWTLLTQGQACLDGPSGFCSSLGCVECYWSVTCPSDDCSIPTCELGACGVTPIPEGQPCVQPSSGFCDASGSCAPCASTCPTPNECQSLTCSGGVCEAAPANTGAPCAGGWCDADGACVECLSAADCDGDCREDVACVEGACQFTVVQWGLCSTGHCDAAGQCQECINDSHCPWPQFPNYECYYWACDDNQCVTNPSCPNSACCPESGTCISSTIFCP